MSPKISGQINCSCPQYTDTSVLEFPEIKNHQFSISVGSQINLFDRFTFMAEYYPLLRKKNPGINNAFVLVLNTQTGGACFSIVFFLYALAYGAICDGSK